MTPLPHAADAHANSCINFFDYRTFFLILILIAAVYVRHNLYEFVKAHLDFNIVEHFFLVQIFLTYRFSSLQLNLRTFFRLYSDAPMIVLYQKMMVVHYVFAPMNLY